MQNFDSIIEDLRKAEKKNDIRKCIEICRNTLLNNKFYDDKFLFKIKFELANFLLDIESNKQENIDESIQILLKLKAKMLKEVNSKEYAYVNLGLGYAFEQRIQGARHDNLLKCLKHYEKALIFFKESKNPQKRASVKSGIGLAYSEMATENNTLEIIKAIENYLETLHIYTKDEHPEVF